MTDVVGDKIAVLHDLRLLEPRLAALEMPRQVLERPHRPSLMDLVSRLLLRNA